MIFVPFTGVDSHKRCVTFAAGLLYNETIESYSWLLECFLKAHGKQPTLVLTDQDPAMKQAVEDVLSESRHRLCMWHIMKKLPTKIPPEMFKNTDVRAKIHKLVWSVYNKPSTFEKQWADLVQAYGLEGNSWLSDMYSIRELWVPCYFREIQMCCLMKTTSRCESSNVAFKVNSSSGNTLVQFLLCLDTTIDQQRYSQRLSQFKTKSTSVDMLTGQNIEKHASLIYTQTIFKEVSKEIHKGMLVCFITNVDDVNGVKVYTVTQFNNINKEAELVHHFQVCVDITTETFACSCMCYTRIGYLCRHIFCVFRPFKIEKIPVKYIMDRWRRDAVPVSVFAVEKRYGVDFSEHSMVRIEVQDIVNECLDRLRDNHDKLLHFAESIRELKSELFSMLSKGDPSIKHDNQVISHLVGEPVSVNVECTNPHGIRNKGTRKSKRPIGHVEPEPVKPPKCPRKCKTCGEYVIDHDSRNCHKMRGSASAPPK